MADVGTSGVDLAKEGDPETSLILIKPDGYRSAAVRKLLFDSLKTRALKVIQRKMLHLGREETVGIWPVFGRDDHMVMREMYCRYIGSGPCEALLVEGDRALATCLHIKTDIRKRFEVCAFENAVHSPTDASELVANRAHLFGGISLVPEPSWPEWSKRGRFGRAAEVPLDEIERIADAIWRDRASDGWQGVFPARSDKPDASHRAVLRPGDPNSIDYGISVLFNTLNDCSFAFSVRAYIEAEVVGSAVIGFGTRDEMLDIQRAFHEHRMVVDVMLVSSPATMEVDRDQA